MSTRALFQLFVGGNDISETVNPILESLTVTDKAGVTSDTCSVVLDDEGGRVIMPSIGDPMFVMLGHSDSGVGQVFDGIVDTIRSNGSRGGGRQLTITGKGFDPLGKAKEPQEFHKDDASMSDFMSEAAGKAGLSFKAGGSLASIKRDYWWAGTESFIHLGHRVAREVGGIFKIKGKEATIVGMNDGMSLSGAMLSSVTATYGLNVLTWDISPVFARPRFEEARTRWYDLKEAKWKEKVEQIQSQGIAGKAQHTHRRTKNDEDEAGSASKNDQKNSERERGGGSITILGDPGAQPEGTCIVVGVRPGIDGAYKIDSVEHTLSRSSGYTTKLDLKHPDGEAGRDGRK